MSPQGSDTHPPSPPTDTWSPLRHQIFQQLRQTIWEMESSADIDQVLEVLRRGAWVGRSPEFATRFGRMKL